MIKLYANTKNGYLQQDLALQLLDQSEFYWEATTTSKSIKHFPFYRLFLKDDDITNRKYGFIEQKVSPLGFTYRKLKADGLTLLPQKWQTQRKRVWAEHLNGQDILRVGEDVLLVSEKCKELLEEHKLTGFIFEPCLIEGKEYPEDVVKFGGSLQSPVELANCFQLVITAVANPINMGAAFENEENGIKRLIKDSDMPTYYFFSPEDLKDKDVQVVNKIQGIDNHQKIEFNPDPIFSHRFLQLIIDYKLKGLRPFSSKPKIDYVVVPVRAEAYDDNIHKGHWDIDTIKQYLAT